MSYQLPVVSDFKTQFSVRDFPYGCPVTGGGSGAAATATIGGTNSAITAWTVTAPGSGYQLDKPPTAIVQYGGGFGAKASVQTGAVGNNPTVIEVIGVTVVAPGYGYTDLANPPFLYISNGLGDNTDTEKVRDFDIAHAQAKAMAFNMTSTLFGSQLAFTTAYNLLTAHYLCETLLAAGTGLGGKAEWLTSSKTVGSVSESFQIPDRILKSPILSKFSKTTYGSQFLELVAPLLQGNFAAQGFFRFGRP